MKKFMILFLVSLCTNVTIISAYNHSIDPQKIEIAKLSNEHKDKKQKKKKCDVCCCIDHIFAFTQAQDDESIEMLFNKFNFFCFPPDTFALEFRQILAQSGNKILLHEADPTEFLIISPGNYYVEFSGFVDAGIGDSGFDPKIVFLTDCGHEIPEFDSGVPVFTLPLEDQKRNSFFKCAIIEVPKGTCCKSPLSFRVAWQGIDEEQFEEVEFFKIQYSLKIIRLTGPNCNGKGFFAQTPNKVKFKTLKTFDTLVD